MTPDPMPGRTQTPVFDFSPSQDEPNAWRRGRVLVVSREWEADDRCIKCGAPAGEMRIERNLNWHPPILYLTLFAGIVLYVILAVILRKRATIRFAVCPAHRRQHWKLVGTAWSAALVGLALLFTMAFTNGLVGFGGLVLLLFGLVGGATVVPYLRPMRIEDERAWLVGCSPEYLAPLPQLK